MNRGQSETVLHLDLRGQDKLRIESSILQCLGDPEQEMRLNCYFDDDPNEALRNLERHCAHWSFQRIERAHWLICNCVNGGAHGLGEALRSGLNEFQAVMHQGAFDRRRHRR